jgi:hypothetical protein
MDDKYRELMRFIAGYESPESPQSIDEIEGDFQLAGLMTTLNKEIAHKPTPLILDIGCGNGVLFAKLSETGCFIRYPDLFYKGFDSSSWLPKAFENATILKVLPKVTLLPLDQSWSTHMKAPCIVVIRNVLHELSLSEASSLIHRLCSEIPDNSIFFLQDMSTLPVAEKGRCGWMGFHVENILRECGMETVLTIDTSKRGVDIYLIEGKRKDACKKTEKDIMDLLRQARAEQLKILLLKYSDLKEHPENTLPILRLNHDIAALSLQMGLLANGKKDEEIISSTFSLAFKALSITDFNELRLKFTYPSCKWFQNRGGTITAVDDFLSSNKSILLVIGPPYIGKKTVVWHALDKKKHSRLPVFIDLFTGVTISNILETLAAQLGIARLLDVEILAALKTYRLDKLFITVDDIAKTIAMNTILILDSFENVTDPESTINNIDVKELIDRWSLVGGAKIIIESRVKVRNLPSRTTEQLTVFKSRAETPRFGTFLYSVQMLQEIVPNEYRIPNSEHNGFPLDLLTTMDNHPFFLYIAGTAIRNNPDTNCLSDPTFVSHLKIKLADTLFSTFDFNRDEKELLFALTLIQDGFPLKLLDMVIPGQSISMRLLEKGVILEMAPDAYKVIGILRFINKTIREQYEKKNKGREWHKRFRDAFLQLYKTTSNPSFYRQAHYHTVLGGDTSGISAFNIPELSRCVQSWYDTRQFKDALWGYSQIKKYRQLTAKESMHEASSLMHTNLIHIGQVFVVH